jgi:hypothetical protein
MAERYYYSGGVAEGGIAFKYYVEAPYYVIVVVHPSGRTLESLFQWRLDPRGFGGCDLQDWNEMHRISDALIARVREMERVN